jgi:hypothetical protein
MAKLIKKPLKYQKIIDAASKRDKEYFEKNKHVNQYFREYIIGEFFPQDDTDIIGVVVTQYQEGIRSRMPLFKEKSN